jgi:hypothetical protein
MKLDLPKFIDPMDKLTVYAERALIKQTPVSACVRRNMPWTAIHLAGKTRPLTVIRRGQDLDNNKGRIHQFVTRLRNFDVQKPYR